MWFMIFMSYYELLFMSALKTPRVSACDWSVLPPPAALASTLAAMHARIISFFPFSIDIAVAAAGRRIARSWASR